MGYTKGVLETAIQAVYDRIKSHTLTGERLVDIKDVSIGYRPREAGESALPRITIGIVDFSEETRTMAQSAGQKTGSLRLEIRLACERLKGTTEARSADNVLFDGAGKGAIAYFQWLCDALTLTSADAYAPEIGLALDTIPDATFNIDETGNSIEIVVEVVFTLRYTMGAMGGTLTA